MEPLPKKQWGRLVCLAITCYYKFKLFPPINLEECNDAIKDLEYNLDVLWNTTMEHLFPWWLKQIVMYRPKYPSAIKSAYRLLHGFTKHAEPESEKSITHESEICAVCLDKLEETGRIQMKLVCNHIYHEDCIVKWVYSHKTCPLCRVVAVRDYETVQQSL